jgi:hypothetical protein
MQFIENDFYFNSSQQNQLDSDDLMEELEQKFS